MPCLEISSDKYPSLSVTSYTLHSKANLQSAKFITNITNWKLSSSFQELIPYFLLRSHQNCLVQSYFFSFLSFFSFSFFFYHFWSLYWICYNIASIFVFMFFGQEACGILASRPGIEMPPILEDEVVTTGPSRSLFNHISNSLFKAI